MHNPVQQAMLDLLPEGFQKSLACLFIATEEADHYEDVSSELWNALLPPSGLVRRTEAMYRSHVRELLSRATLDLPFDHLTDAEVLEAISHASLKAPLNQPGALLYHGLFRSIFGEAHYNRVNDGASPPRPSWPTQFDELLYEAKRRGGTMRPKRVPKPRRKTKP